MTKRVINRVLLGVATLLGVYTITFLMVIATPGNPFQRGDRQMPPEVLAALESRYHIDNHATYYVEYLWRVIRYGDFGPAFNYRDWTCNQILAQALPVSVIIGLLAMLIAVMVGVPVGVLSAVHRDSWFDLATLSLVLLGISLPTFVTGSALLTVFAVYMKSAPIGGWGTIAHLPLPALTLSLPFMAYIARLTRVGMLDVLGSDFIRTAVAKGVPPRQVIWRHAFKIAFLPVLSVLGPATAQAMTGSFVVEKVFNVPGLGQHFVDAALNLDRGMILATVLVFSAMLIVFNMIVDILYSVVDPRIESPA